MKQPYKGCLMNWIVIIWLFCGEGRATENIILGYFSIKAVTREDVRGVAGVAFRYTSVVFAILTSGHLLAFGLLAYGLLAFGLLAI